MKEKTTLNNFEEYNDPILYDKENDALTNDVKFLEKWAAKTEGKIIDIACGTGRATIPLARKGHRLIGIDLHEGMLNEAKKKAADHGLHIEWVRQDCSNFKLNVKSRLIYSVGNSFQHFLTNEAQDGLLKSVNRHLETGGIFIFGTRFPNAEELLLPNDEEFWRTYTDSETQHRVDVYTIGSYDPLTQIQHNTTIRKYINKNEEMVDVVKTNISLRYVFPKEMERLLASNGFEIVSVYQDWDETPITADGNQMIYVCKKIR